VKEIHGFDLTMPMTDAIPEMLADSGQLKAEFA
jgi:hypothetical protein